MNRSPNRVFMNKALMLSLSLFVVALAGCTDDGGAADDLKNEFQGQGTGSSSSSSASSSGSASSSSSSSESSSEEPEEGTITVNFAASTNIGEAPLTVDFSILAKAINADGTENEDPFFEWAIFDADENSTSGIDESGIDMPANVTFTFNDAGNYSIVAGVTAEGYQSGFATIDITVGEVPVVERPTQSLSCVTRAGAAGVALYPSAPVVGDVNVGGCRLGTVPEGVWEIMEMDEGGCNIQYDSNGDSQADGESEIGQTHTAGTGQTAFCDPGIFDATSSMTISQVI